MGFNMSSIQISSSGMWQGDDPLYDALPLLIIQTTLVIGVSRFLAFLLKPLRQPKVIAEILGGILLGPSALGRNTHFLNTIFPPWSTTILNSVASIGLLFFLFLVGLELDLDSIRRCGRRSFLIALSGLALPFTLATIVTLVIHRTMHYSTPYLQTLVFIGVSLSITAFPVLARILAELKLLTTEVGKTAMSAAAFNDVAAWVLLALAVALTSENGPSTAHHNGPLTTVWILLSALGFVGFMLILVRPLMNWIVNNHCSSSEQGSDGLICLTLVGVMVSGFVTDLIGIHSIFGAFVFGLCIPKSGEFGSGLIRRIEDFVSSLLLPLYFAASGLKTDVSKIRGAEAWGLLALVTSAACVGKIFGTFFASMMCMIPARESLTLGLLMNTKGLVELIVLNIGREKKVLDDEMFTILVLMALITTFMTTPMVLSIYKPANADSSWLTRNNYNKQESSSSSRSSSTEKNEELRVICCVHGTGNVPSMINLIELIRGPKRSPFKLYVLHLMEFIDRSSSIWMVQRARKNGLPFISRLSRGKSNDQVAIAFEAYAEVSHVKARPTTVISGLHTMHEDICHVAKRKRTKLIILPFNKQWSGESDKDIEPLGHGWKMVNQRVLQNASCSVAVFVDRGFCSENCSRNESDCKTICVLFFGGSDDREALKLAGRMLESVVTRVNVIKFVQISASTEMTNDKELDEAALAGFKQRWGKVSEYTERVAGDNVMNQVVEIGKTGEYELIMTGKGKSATIMDVNLANQLAEWTNQLGPIGGVLASTSGIVSSIMVIQQPENVVNGSLSA